VHQLGGGEAAEVDRFPAPHRPARRDLRRSRAHRLL